MAIKGVSVDLEEDLHRAVRAAATSRGILTGDAYTEALRAWLDAQSGSIESPWGEITTEESDYAGAVLDYVRNNQDRALIPTLDELVRRFKSLPRRAKRA